ncbi:hypothetical protein [Vibrio scophthalmi]|uniref:Uncharacterized protein n=1 Tax=Vibrio scophthalmi TaxID=45658 RepID=A0A1E3WJ26_9VIBR|nr:hypothetical protein [Vibrio scophthalmi]ODS09761.1 hypothetical protein VSF3289_03223 [Vibrio scophthalmi]
MDTTELIVEYSAGDFAQSIRQLLPKGKYWQESENRELTNLIDGIATDFKQTHDDIELSLLGQKDEELFGWKLVNYQRLLNEIGSIGTVYDDINNPNLIKIDLFSYDNDKAYAAFEEKRLPHTEFAWVYPLDANTEFHQNTALTLAPVMSSELELIARAQLICSTAISWQLEIGDIA